MNITIRDIPLKEFEYPQHVGRPNIGDQQRFLERVSTLLDRRWLTNNGPLVKEFEQRITEKLNVKHCVCVCNATIGLELAIRALGITNEAIVPSYTFVATAHALQWQAITPVFADLDPATYNIDTANIERHITPKTTGIIATHVWGRACDIDALTEVAHRHNLKLIFDAAHAFGCSYRGRMLGSFGNAEVFSFHATKFLNSFEGGAITTNDDELANRLRLMTNFGFSGYDNVIHVGTNGKMTEICAAMGLTNLEAMDGFIERNFQNYRLYKQLLSGIPGLSVITYDEKEQNNYQYVVVEVDETITKVSRDSLVQLLHEHNVLARKYFWPGCHEMQPYRSLQPYARLLLPETIRVAARVMVLPTGTSTSEQDIRTICSLISRAVMAAQPVAAASNQGMAIANT